MRVRTARTTPATRKFQLLQHRMQRQYTLLDLWKKLLRGLQLRWGASPPPEFVMIAAQHYQRVGKAWPHLMKQLLVTVRQSTQSLKSLPPSLNPRLSQACSKLSWRSFGFLS